jgi:hypothetical protein
VTVEGRGRVPLTSVKAGERLLASDSAGHVTYSDVILFLHRDVDAQHVPYYSLHTDSGHVIRLTANHLIYRSRCHDNSNFALCAEAVFADDVRLGDLLFDVAANTSNVMTSRVVTIDVTREEGMYAPLTTLGNVIVDDVIVSCYATIGSQSLAHASFAPARLWHTVLPTLAESHVAAQVTHWYLDLLTSIGSLVLPPSVWYGSATSANDVM